MNQATVKLTIGKETREVQATISTRPHFTVAIVRGLQMRTSSGNETHTGWAEFLFNESGEYNIDKALDIRYVGMRGNGHAKRSKFRYVGF